MLVAFVLSGTNLHWLCFAELAESMLTDKR